MMPDRHVEEAVERKIVASEGHRRAGDRLFAARASIREAFGELGLADWDLDDLEVYLAGSPGFLTIDDDQQWKVIGLVAGSIITAVEQVRSDHEATLTAERERRERAEAELRRLARIHHNTLKPSKLHDPENQSWRECPCLPCTRVRTLLGEGGTRLECARCGNEAIEGIVPCAYCLKEAERLLKAATMPSGEALEAVAREVFRDVMKDRRASYRWEDLDDEDRRRWLPRAQRYLQAALPQPKEEER